MTRTRLLDIVVVDSRLFLLNDGRIPRMPDVSTHTATAINPSLVTPDLAVNGTWSTEQDCLGSDHLRSHYDTVE